MSAETKLHIFGEVLYDCFPSGENVLGGAPFNVAWHLHALGDAPHFISRVGEDDLGREILDAMTRWGMATSGVQRDPAHPTGRVNVTEHRGQPSYDIQPGVAYDFIAADSVPCAESGDMLYHGSLALRNPVSREAFEVCARDPECRVFMDVNLRAPWWSRAEVTGWLERACWAKMNEDELWALGFDDADLRDNMRTFQERFGVAHLIVTRGKQGALVRTADGSFYGRPPPPLDRRVDTVGAGDSFSAIYLHGIRAGWPIEQTIERAQAFANEIIGMRGATPTDQALYESFR